MHAFKILYPVPENVSKMDTGVQKSLPRKAAHTRIGIVWEYPPLASMPSNSMIVYKEKRF